MRHFLLVLTLILFTACSKDVPSDFELENTTWEVVGTDVERKDDQPIVFKFTDAHFSIESNTMGIDFNYGLFPYTFDGDKTIYLENTQIDEYPNEVEMTIKDVKKSGKQINLAFRNGVYGRFALERM